MKNFFITKHLLIMGIHSGGGEGGSKLGLSGGPKFLLNSVEGNMGGLFHI